MKYKVVYYFLDLLRKMHQNLSVILVAIDEAHCVSSWGHDFRPQYRELGQIRNNLPDVPILAVTATATAKVRNDIIACLKLRFVDIKFSYESKTY